MYPGGLVGHWTVQRRPGSTGDAPHELFRTQVDFSSHQMHEGSPETEFRQKLQTWRMSSSSSTAK